MSTKLAVAHVYKVFGAHPERAMERVKTGQSKDDIFAATGMTVGVADAGFEVATGEVFVVMGLSGSGKSTLVRMLNRLIEPTSGSISVDGRDITRMSRRELIDLRRHHISMVFQSFALMPHQTVLENTAFGLGVAGLSRGERHQRALDALDAVGLKANANSFPDELSGGMKQRVGLARALAVNPGILLMDEAFSALDPLIRTEMQDELLRLQAEQARTVVFITHDLDEAMRVGDRIAVMQAGQVVQIGTPDAIVRAPANEYVRSFFHGVDVSQVLKAADVARADEIPTIERTDLESAAKKLEDNQHQVAAVQDEAGRYLGLVTAASLRAAMQSATYASTNNRGRASWNLFRRRAARARGGDASTQSAIAIDEALVAGASPVQADTPLTELMEAVADADWPVAVVDKDQRYRGAISPARLLHTLNRTEKQSAA